MKNRVTCDLIRIVAFSRNDWLMNALKQLLFGVFSYFSVIFTLGADNSRRLIAAGFDTEMTRK